MKFLNKETLSAFFAKIAEKEALYLPQKQENGKAAYKEWREGAEYARNLNTVRSAKDFFFPQTENLMDFKMEGKNITIEDTRKECEDFVLFGVRACDARSFDILDSVYLANPVDTYYQNRRSHGTVITVACTRPGESCFCHVFGIDATDPAGDVTAWETGEGFFFRANTEKGEALLAAAGDLLSEKDAAAVEEQRAAVKAVQAKMPLATLTAEGFGGGLTKELFDRPEWKTLSGRASGAAVARSIAPPASATTSGILTPGTGSSASVAGIPVCIPISRRCPRVSPAPRSWSGSASALCTNWSTIPKTTAGCSVVWVAGGA